MMIIDLENKLKTICKTGRKYTLETLKLNGVTFVNVPAVCENRDGSWFSVGFSSKILSIVDSLLLKFPNETVIDFSKYFDSVRFVNINNVFYQNIVSDDYNVLPICDSKKELFNAFSEKFLKNKIERVCKSLNKKSSYLQNSSIDFSALL